MRHTDIYGTATIFVPIVFLTAHLLYLAVALGLRLTWWVLKRAWRASAWLARANVKLAIWLVALLLLPFIAVGKTLWRCHFPQPVPVQCDPIEEFQEAIQERETALGVQAIGIRWG